MVFGRTEDYPFGRTASQENSRGVSGRERSRPERRAPGNRSGVRSRSGNRARNCFYPCTGTETGHHDSSGARSRSGKGLPDSGDVRSRKRKGHVDDEVARSGAGTGYSCCHKEQRVASARSTVLFGAEVIFPHPSRRRAARTACRGERSGRQSMRCHRPHRYYLLFWRKSVDSSQTQQCSHL